ncbi:hypothetical protein [Agromyces larvae]|uniref:PH domain-containing protein n=1 Tax=Agromyces larvae TaxID=2929802 RepID=A0ABY4C469_9MICO|nr:hypothetical protein [Agromyces larvae]UOE45212.1 hypothetical protein MTO99_05415 [Agromyces larvae]
MGYWIGAALAVVVIGAAGWLMIRSWRRRSERDAALSAYPVPTSLGAAAIDCEVLYVATTPEGRPLERLALPGLAFRGSGRVEVAPEGVVLRIAGELPGFLPADRIAGAARATWAIDRGVEPEGLVAITWIANETEPAPTPTRVDSYLRARYPGDAAGIIAAVTDIAAAPEPRPADTHESEASE